MTGSREPLSASPSLFPRQTVLSIGKLKYSIGELSEFYFTGIKLRESEFKELLFTIMLSLAKYIFSYQVNQIFYRHISKYTIIAFFTILY